MTTPTVTLFLSLLTLGAGAVVATGVALAVGRRLHPGAARVADHVRGAVAPSALALAGLVAVTATLGSLYYSEVAGYTPCTLCWYQRIAMYPLAVMLPLAAWKRDPGVARYAYALTAIGAVISAYHYQLEWFPQQAAVACSAAVPCTAVWFRTFGFVSLPFMALTGFAVIATLLLACRRPEDPPATPSADRPGHG